MVFLLFVFSIQTFKSLWIVSSFHINRNYIAENICINRFDKIPTCKGKCVLDNQLSKEQKQNKETWSSTEKTSDFIVPELSHLLPECTIKLFSADLPTKYISSVCEFFIIKIKNPPEN